VALVERVDRLELEVVEGEGKERSRVRHTPEAKPS
jgi:hypothetical protein